MTDEVPANLTSEIYAIDELNSDTNSDFPLAMTLLKEEQLKDDNIQTTIQKHSTNDRFGTMEFGNTTVHTIDGKIIVPANLQRRIIEWYHHNLRHPGNYSNVNDVTKPSQTTKKKTKIAYPMSIKLEI
jgi:hypothetical protein